MALTITNHEGRPQRADIILSNALTDYSRAALSKLFTKGFVTLNNEPIRAGTKIKIDQEFIVNLDALEMPAEKLDLPIIYEDENVIVIDKPVGVISHARGKYWNEASVASFVRDKVMGIEGERAGIVHRLDRATSGVMICAKNSETLSLLQKQFSQRKTKKIYFAVVEGTPDPAQAIIEVPLGRNPNKPQTFRADKSGKQSSSEYEVIKSNGTYSLLKLTPKTGRTHQLRVHLQYIKHPILGDELYGDSKSERLFLHASSLEITLPGGERKVFVSEVPAMFEAKVK
jgi:23S rRNA pseudouridine1911/1915/1917 synthase